MSTLDVRPIDIQATAALRAAFVASKPDWEAVCDAVLAGADANARLPARRRGVTALQIAVLYGFTPAVNTLLDCGADPAAGSEEADGVAGLSKPALPSKPGTSDRIGSK